MGLLYKMFNRGGKFLPSEVEEKVKSQLTINGNPNSLCLAPHKSLRFAHTGNIMACCFNREYVLGKYPQDSLNEIWFGNRKGVIAKALKNGDFSKGCNGCYNDLISGNVHNSGLAQYQYLAKLPGSKYPSMLDFEIGSTCNLECIMCNGEYSSTIRKNREGCSPYAEVYDDNFIEQLKEFIPYLNEARFVGGEPFLVNIHYPLWETILELNPTCKISILTNGTVWNNRCEKIFQGGNVHVSFSIDSVDPGNYRDIRKGGNLDKVLGNFQRVKDLSDKLGRPVFVNVCLMRQNIETIGDTISYFDKQGVEVIFHEVHYPFHTSIWNSSESELLALASNLSRVQFGSSETSSKNEARVNSILARIGGMQRVNSQIDTQRQKLLSMDYDGLKTFFIGSISEAGSNDLTERIRLNLTLIEKHMDRAAIKLVMAEMLLFPRERLIGEIENISDDRLVMKFRFAFG